MRLRRLRPQVLRAAWWALRALEQARRQAAAGGLGELRVPAPPRLPDHARVGVSAVLRRRPTTCLHRAAVWQAWDAAHGRPRDLVIGVTAPSAGFRAHAWLDGDPRCHDAEFAELTRRPPPAG